MGRLLIAMCSIGLSALEHKIDGFCDEYSNFNIYDLILYKTFEKNFFN